MKAKKKVKSRETFEVIDDLNCLMYIYDDVYAVQQ